MIQGLVRGGGITLLILSLILFIRSCDGQFSPFALPMTPAPLMPHPVPNIPIGYAQPPLHMPNVPDKTEVILLGNQQKEGDHHHHHHHHHHHSHHHGHHHAHGHDHKHEHKHGHDHKHDHKHGHDHKHDHGHEHKHEHGHQHLHAHKHGHNHDHKHAHNHGHQHEHNHNHAHNHGHDHKHDHQHGHDHKHNHLHGHNHKHGHAHKHGHFHKHGHEYAYQHGSKPKYQQEHGYDHKNSLSHDQQYAREQDHQQDNNPNQVHDYEKKQHIGQHSGEYDPDTDDHSNRQYRPLYQQQNKSPNPPKEDFSTTNQNYGRDHSHESQEDFHNTPKQSYRDDPQKEKNTRSQWDHSSEEPDLRPRTFQRSQDPFIPSHNRDEGFFRITVPERITSSHPLSKEEDHKQSFESNSDEYRKDFRRRNGNSPIRRKGLDRRIPLNEASISSLTFLRENGDIVTLGNNDPYLSIEQPLKVNHDGTFSGRNIDRHLKSGLKVTPAKSMKLSLGDIGEIFNVPLFD